MVEWTNIEPTKLSFQELGSKDINLHWLKIIGYVSADVKALDLGISWVKALYTDGWGFSTESNRIVQVCGLLFIGPSLQDKKMESPLSGAILFDPILLTINLR